MRHLAALSLTAFIALSVAACGPAAPADSPKPSSTPGATPISTPIPTPTSVTDPRPTIDLITSDGHDISAIVNDRTGTLAKVVSGSAGPSMSVRWFEALVVNRDPATLEVTWVGLPVDEAVDVEISRTGDGLAIKIVQAAPPLNSDAMGADRVLVLTFDEPVAAGSVKVTFGSSNPS